MEFETKKKIALQTQFMYAEQLFQAAWTSNYPVNPINKQDVKHKQRTAESQSHKEK